MVESVDPVAKKARLDDSAGAQPMEEDAAAQGHFTEGNVHDLMPLYYSRLFPTTDMYTWLSYGNGEKGQPGADAGFFQRREFCFTLEGDIFVRYQSFKDGAELHQALRDKVPEKIDIGPLYNVDPARRAAYSSSGGAKAFTPVERELVFDVDMTDYDDVRTCCDGASICPQCWPLMTVAIKVLDRGLREDFGFESLLWVYSGRRGVHCWVADKRARQMPDDARTAVAEYFSVYKGGQQAKMSLTNPLHPALEEAFTKVLHPYWSDVLLPKQRFLENPKHITKILDMIPFEDSVRNDLLRKWNSHKAKGEESLSASRWKECEKKIQAETTRLSKSNKVAATALRRAALEVVFVYCYPRLDVEVSKHMNHLLKAPFCVHPKTGRVCVPIDPATCETFDAFAVPTVAQLLNQLDAHEAQQGKSGGPRGEEHGKTALGPFVQSFRQSFLAGCSAQAKADLNNKAKVETAVDKVKGSLDW